MNFRIVRPIEEKSFTLVAMKRMYDEIAKRHLGRYRQMLLLVGPRQVGKTTITLALRSMFHHVVYFNWDIPGDRALIEGSFEALEKHIGLDQPHDTPPVVIFDEIHKKSKWKDWIKGFFDAYEKRVRIVLTGSARLDILKHVGDSLMGRYFLHRIHPLSVREILVSEPAPESIAPPLLVEQRLLDRLLQHGGFPEPYLENSDSFSLQWRKLRFQQLFREEITEITQIREREQIALLGELLIQQAGQLCSYASLAKKIQVSAPTIKSWIELLRAFYFCFTLPPYSKNLPRALLKEPKVYLWDWALISESGPRIENMVASHLLKAVHQWNDCGMGSFSLHFVRDKGGREVDFLVVKEGKPWMLVEVKQSSNHGLSRSLLHFHEVLQTEHAFQVVYKMEGVSVDLFKEKRPLVAPLSTFLSQLP